MKEIVPGAPAAEGVIPLAVPSIGDAERTAVDDALRSGWIAYGPYVDRMEAQIADRLGARYAVGVSSGTAALHVALVLAGVRPGDEVIVSTLTFISPAFAIEYVGARPVLMDADPATWQMDAQKVADFLARECEPSADGLRNRTTGNRIGALLPVGILGHPADMDRLADLATRYELPMVEDAAEGLGALYRNRPVGHLGDIGCLSFNGNKIATCGGGGMIVTDDDAVAARARYLISQAKDDPLEYEHGAVGFNYRLSNVHAALGSVQLDRLDDFVQKKREIARDYAEALADVPGITPPPEAEWARSTFWLYTILVDEDRYGINSRELMRRLIAAGIQVRPLWQPLHHSRALPDAQAYLCQTAEKLHARGLSLPCSTDLSSGELQRVVEEIRRHAT